MNCRPCGSWHNGNLALKYRWPSASINSSAKLNRAIEWTIGDVAMGTEQHLAAGESNAFTIKGHMKSLPAMST